MKYKKRRYSERGIERRLQNLLQRVLENRGGQVETFEERGVLTYNRGLVLSLPGHQEFQITIIDSSRY